MYAVIASGGKQYRVNVGDTVYVEKLDKKDGAKVGFDVVMYVNEDDVRVGKPTLSDIVVEGKVVRQVKSKKVIVFKYKAKKNVRKKQGHRQPHTAVNITAIKVKESKTKDSKETKE
jgi:large subunit ribosomal protein L21